MPEHRPGDRLRDDRDRWLGGALATRRARRRTAAAPRARRFRGWRSRSATLETDVALPTGERGEIVVRGPQVFRGYFKAPEKNAEVLEPAGWFHTGDLGASTTTGCLHYLGRAKDMLKVGGENVAAIEIESYLATHPAVSIAQVVGVPDAKYVEVARRSWSCKPGGVGDGGGDHRRSVGGRWPASRCRATCGW